MMWTCIAPIVSKTRPLSAITPMESLQGHLSALDHRRGPFVIIQKNVLAFYRILRRSFQNVARCEINRRLSLRW